MCYNLFASEMCWGVGRGNSRDIYQLQTRVTCTKYVRNVKDVGREDPCSLVGINHKVAAY
jgi:hypothetical protein